MSALLSHPQTRASAGSRLPGGGSHSQGSSGEDVYRVRTLCTRALSRVTDHGRRQASATEEQPSLPHPPCLPRPPLAASACRV